MALLWFPQGLSAWLASLCPSCLGSKTRERCFPLLRMGAWMGGNASQWQECEMQEGLHYPFRHQPDCPLHIILSWPYEAGLVLL